MKAYKIKLQLVKFDADETFFLHTEDIYVAYWTGRRRAQSHFFMVAGPFLFYAEASST